MDLHQIVSSNMSGRDFVIGDLHGMYDEFMKGLDRIKFDPQADRIFSVGDLIDRGPDSILCLKLLQEPWFYAVQGNHERLMIDSLVHKLEAPYSTWIANGGAWTFDTEDIQLENWAKYLDQLPITISIERPNSLPIGIVHAEFPLDHWDERLQFNKIEDTAISTMMWSRAQIKAKEPKWVEGVDRIYCGHTPIHSIQVLGNCYFIDLGCYNSNNLALIEI